MLFAAAFTVLCPAAGCVLGQEPLNSEEPNSQTAVEPLVLREATEEGTFSAEAPESRTSGVPIDYVIGPEDVLEIEVFEVTELSQTVRVANNGTISLALLGHVQAAGLTSQQLQESLENQYAQDYLQDPKVSIFVKEFHALPVSVIGAVERPGLYQVSGPRTLIEVLSMAGGLGKGASGAAGRTLIVTRKGGFSDLATAPGMQLVASDKLEIDTRELFYSPESALNIAIRPLDTISVTHADMVYVVGEVKKPTGILMANQDGLTVLQALALAEGLNSTASKKSARIIRKLPDGLRSEIPVDLGKIIKGKAEDIELAANDVLFVPGSKGKVALSRGVSAAIATVTGLIIWRSR